MPFRHYRSPEHLFNTYALYPLIVLLLPLNDAVKRPTSYTELCCYYQAFAYVVFMLWYLGIAIEMLLKIAFIFKVPVINYGRVTGTQSLEV